MWWSESESDNEGEQEQLGFCRGRPRCCLSDSLLFLVSDFTLCTVKGFTYFVVRLSGLGLLFGLGLYHELISVVRIGILHGPENPSEVMGSFVQSSSCCWQLIHDDGGACFQVNVDRHVRL